MLTLNEFAEVLVNGRAEDLRDTDYSPAFLLVPLGDLPPLSSKTALGEVIKQGNLHLAERFIQRDPDCVNTSNSEGQTPIYEAIAAKNIEMITLLHNNHANLEHAYETPNDVYSSVKTPIYYAMQCADATTIQHLLNLKPDISLQPNPLLAVSCSYTGDKIVPLIQAGAKTDFIDVLGRTALHRAAMWGDTAAIEVLCNQVNYLNKVDKAGHTPLDYAKYFPDPSNQKGKELTLIGYGARASKKISVSGYGKMSLQKPSQKSPYGRSRLKNSTENISNNTQSKFSYFKPVANNETKENYFQTCDLFSQLQI